jgi:hypothetical protein
MTAVEEITQNVTIKFVKGLHEKGLDANFIAVAFKLPVKKVEKIIQIIKSVSN